MTVALSQNAWPVVSTSSAPVLVSCRWITGKVRAGDVAVVFDHLGARFNAEVETIVQGWSWGYALRAIRGAADTSNHGSGTAVDFNAPLHILGRRGTFTARQVNALRGILTALDDVVRWGGDYTGRADEMHFEIHAPAEDVARVAARILAGRASAPATTPTPITPRGFLMALTDEQQAQVFEQIAELGRLLGPHGDTTGKIDAILQNSVDIEGGVAGFPALLSAVSGANVPPEAIVDSLSKISTETAHQVIELWQAWLARAAATPT